MNFIRLLVNVFQLFFVTDAFVNRAIRAAIATRNTFRVRRRRARMAERVVSRTHTRTSANVHLVSYDTLFEF